MDLLEKGNIGKAKNRATDAVRDYYRIFMYGDRSMTDLNLLNYGEALVMVNRIDDAINVLEEIEVPSLRYYFVLGICMKSIGEWRQAIEMFKSAVKEMEEEPIEDPDSEGIMTGERDFDEIIAKAEEIMGMGGEPEPEPEMGGEEEPMGGGEEEPAPFEAEDKKDKTISERKEKFQRIS